MRTNLVHSGLLVAVGIQLPAVQSGLQSQGQAQEAEMYSEKSVWVPKSGKGKRERGCLEPRGWGGPRAIREPTVGVGGRGLLGGAGKAGWRGQCGLGYRSLVEPSGVRGCEHKLRSTETGQ